LCGWGCRRALNRQWRWLTSEPTSDQHSKENKYNYDPDAL